MVDTPVGFLCRVAQPVNASSLTAETSGDFSGDCLVLMPTLCSRLPAFCDPDSEGEDLDVHVEDCIFPGFVQSVAKQLRRLTMMLMAGPEPAQIADLRTMHAEVSVLQAYDDESLISGLARNIQAPGVFLPVPG